MPTAPLVHPSITKLNHNIILSIAATHTQQSKKPNIKKKIDKHMHTQGMFESRVHSSCVKYKWVF